MILLMRLYKRDVKTVWYGLQAISYMGPEIWGLVPKQMKQVTTLNEFQAKIKTWKLENCPSWLSRTYLPQVRFTILCLSTQTNVVRLRARGTLSGNTSPVVICISIKLRKRWEKAERSHEVFFCHCCYFLLILLSVYVYMNKFCQKRFVFLVFYLFVSL